MSVDTAVKEIVFQSLKSPEGTELIREILYSEKAMEKSELSREALMEASKQGNVKGDNAATINIDERLVQQLQKKVDGILLWQENFRQILREELKEHQNAVKQKQEDSNEKIKELEDKIRQLTRDNSEQTSALEKIEKAHKEMVGKYNKTMQKYESFSIWTKTWDALNEIPEEDKSYLAGLCGSFSQFACMSLGRDQNKLEQLWNYIKDKAVASSPDYNSIEKLSAYFDTCIHQANFVLSEGQTYEVKAIKVGSDFCREMCIRTGDSRQIGTVQQVVLGCVIQGEKVRYRAIVRVG